MTRESRIVRKRCKTETEFKAELDKLTTHLLRSYEQYAARILKIQTKKGKLLPLKLNSVQRLLLRIIVDMRARNLLVRLIILKARRQGVSTFTLGRFFWRVSNRPNSHAVSITHEPDATDFLFSMVKRYYDHAPKEFQPETKYNNKKILEFNNKQGTGLDSAFRVGTAGKGDYGSGTLTHYLHLSELSKYPAHVVQDLLTSILQTVPKSPESEIIIESTAKGAGGEFYDRFWAARYNYELYLDEEGKPAYKFNINQRASEENVYASVFIPWFVFDEYQMPAPEGFKRINESSAQTFLDQYGDEESLARTHGLSDDQLYWRRVTIKNECGGSLDMFAQEYPATAEESFLTSGRPVFDNFTLRLLRKTAPDPVARYEWDSDMAGTSWSQTKNGRLKVWTEPVSGRPYVIGADAAEGLEHGDYSAACVVDQLTGEQVAEWHGSIDPDQFAYLLASLGARYNHAWLVPERNNNGLTTVTTLHRYIGYKKLYVEKIPEPPNKIRKRFGWHTSRGNKHDIVNALIQDLREETHGLKSADLMTEMLSFVHHEDGSLGAVPGKNDDLVMARVIAGYVWDKLPKPRMTVLREGSPIKHTRNVKPPTEGWT